MTVEGYNILIIVGLLVSPVFAYLLYYLWNRRRIHEAFAKKHTPGSFSTKATNDLLERLEFRSNELLNTLEKQSIEQDQRQKNLEDRLLIILEIQKNVEAILHGKTETEEARQTSPDIFRAMPLFFQHSEPNPRRSSEMTKAEFNEKWILPAYLRRGGAKISSVQITDNYKRKIVEAISHSRSFEKIVDTNALWSMLNKLDINDLSFTYDNIENYLTILESSPALDEETRTIFVQRLSKLFDLMRFVTQEGPKIENKPQ